MYESIMIFAYRYIPYVHRSITLPDIPLIIFQDIIAIRALSTISMDVIESLWKKNGGITVSMEYDDMEVYYFLLPDNYPNTDTYRQLDVSHDDHYDNYAKPIIRRFVARLHCRIRTRHYIEAVQKDISVPPTELVYHQQLLEKIRIDSLTSDQYETCILRQHLRESEEIVQGEKDYRPNGTGYHEVKEDFEDLVLLTTPLTTKRSASVHGY